MSWIALPFIWTACCITLHHALRMIARRPCRLRVLGVIPARYESSRFPGKPLVDIAGTPMIIRTYQQATKATTLTRLIVATDDLRIKRVCEQAGAEVMMTDEGLPNGTERCAQVLQNTSGKYDIVVNIQGDEPLIDPGIIDGVVRALQTNPDAVYSTPVTPLDFKDALNTGRVKCIVDQNDYAIYFSRGLVPHNKNGEVDHAHTYWLHLGLQCYEANFLKMYPTLEPTPCQLQEDLEQLKAIEHGYKIKVIKVEHSAHGVDYPEDVSSLESIILNRL